MKRSFASLSPQEGLHVAIFIEERNVEIYRHLAEMFAQFGDPDSVDISIAFREMSMEERGHSSCLQQRYAERYGTRPCSLTEEDLSDLIEVPNLENADVFGARGSRSETPRQKAFAVVLAAENRAADFYRRLADTTPDPGLRIFYQEFVEMESKHANWLEEAWAGDEQRSGRTRLA